MGFSLDDYIREKSGGSVRAGQQHRSYRQRRVFPGPVYGRDAEPGA